MTATTYITRALRLMGILQPTQQASGDQVNTCLPTLIDLIGQLATQNLTIFANVPYTGVLTALQQVYTIGLAAGASFPVVAPEWIDGAAVSVPVSGGQPFEMELDILTDTEWRGIPIKTMQSAYPRAIWYQRVGTSETTAVNSRINVWPVPTQAGLSLALYTPDAMSDNINANTDLAVRLGWRKMFRFNLAKDLLPEFAVVDAKVAAMIIAMADEALGLIKTVNQRDDYPEMAIDAAVAPKRGGYDWRLGVSR